MASISKDPGGHRRIQFISPDGTRKTIRLGKVSQRAAQGFKYKVEELLSFNRLKRPLDLALSQWVVELDDRMAEKLARSGLIPKRHDAESSCLGPFLKSYIEKRGDVKPATKEVWSHVARNLLNSFGERRDMTKITVNDAEDFKMFLIGKKLAPTTVHSHVLPCGI